MNGQQQQNENHDAELAQLKAEAEAAAQRRQSAEQKLADMQAGKLDDETIAAIAAQSGMHPTEARWRLEEQRIMADAVCREAEIVERMKAA